MVKVTVLMAKVVDEGQCHNIEGQGRSYIKVKVTVLKVKVMDEVQGQGHEIEGQGHPSKSGHSSRSRS